MFFCKCHKNQDLYPSKSWFLEILVILFDSIWLSRSEMTKTFSYPDPVLSPAFPPCFVYFWDPWPCRMRPRLESPNRQTYVPPVFTEFLPRIRFKAKLEISTTKNILHFKDTCFKKRHKRHFKKKKGFQLQPFPFSFKKLAFLFFITWDFRKGSKKSSKLWAHPSRRSKILTSFTVS